MSHYGLRILFRCGAQRGHCLLVPLDVDQGAAQFQVATGDIGLQSHHFAQLRNRILVTIFFEIDERPVELVRDLNLLFSDRSPLSR
jgi:hypothetical protein